MVKISKCDRAIESNEMEVYFCWYTYKCYDMNWNKRMYHSSYLIEMNKIHRGTRANFIFILFCIDVIENAADHLSCGFFFFHFVSHSHLLATTHTHFSFTLCHVFRIFHATIFTTCVRYLYKSKHRKICVYNYNRINIARDWFFFSKHHTIWLLTPKTKEKKEIESCNV